MPVEYDQVPGNEMDVDEEGRVKKVYIARHTYGKKTDRDVKLQALEGRIKSWGGRVVHAFQGADVFVISDNKTLTSDEAAYAQEHKVPVVMTSHMRVCEEMKAWVEPTKGHLYKHPLKPKYPQKVAKKPAPAPPGVDADTKDQVQDENTGAGRSTPKRQATPLAPSSFGIINKPRDATTTADDGEKMDVVDDSEKARGTTEERAEEEGRPKRRRQPPTRLVYPSERQPEPRLMEEGDVDMEVQEEGTGMMGGDEEDSSDDDDGSSRKARRKQDEKRTKKSSTKKKARSASCVKAEAAPKDVSAVSETFAAELETAKSFNKEYRERVAVPARRKAAEARATARRDKASGADEAAVASVPSPPEDEQPATEEEEGERPAPDDPSLKIDKLQFYEDHELRAMLVETGEFELRNVSPARMSRTSLRDTYLRHCRPDLELAMLGSGLPEEVREVLLWRSEWGQKRVGVKVVEEALKSVITGLEERMEELHTAYDIQYLSRAKKLLVSLHDFSNAQGKDGKEMWLELRDLFYYTWSGVRDGDVSFAFDGPGLSAEDYEIETQTASGFRVKWLKIVGPDGRICWVLIIWALAYGVHVPHPGRDGSDMWVTGTVRLRHKEAVQAENGAKNMAALARVSLGEASRSMTERELVSAGAGIMGLTGKGKDAKHQWLIDIVADVNGKVVEMPSKKVNNDGNGSEPNIDNCLGYLASTSDLVKAICEDLDITRDDFIVRFSSNRKAQCKLSAIRDRAAKNKLNITFTATNKRPAA